MFSGPRARHVSPSNFEGLYNIAVKFIARSALFGIRAGTQTLLFHSRKGFFLFAFPNYTRSVFYSRLNSCKRRFYNLSWEIKAHYFTSKLESPGRCCSNYFSLHVISHKINESKNIFNRWARGIHSFYVPWTSRVLSWRSLCHLARVLQRSLIEEVGSSCTLHQVKGKERTRARVVWLKPPGNRLNWGTQKDIKKEPILSLWNVKQF